MNRTSRGCFAAVLLIAALALLPGCSSTQVRTARDTAGKPLALSGSVVMIEPDIDLSELGAGGMQVGLASLVDLRTGQVVWHNLLVDQTGDLRNLQGARETAGDLLKGVRGTQPVPAK